MGVATLALALLSGAAAGEATPAGAVQLELPALDGSRFVRLTDFRGLPTVLNFWGSECPPCAREMPMLDEASRRYAGVQFLGIAVDDRASARRFLARFPANYPQLIAPNRPEVLLRRLGNRTAGLPYTVVLNSQHQVCRTRLGEVDARWIALALESCGADGNGQTRVDPQRPGSRRLSSPASRTSA